MIQALLIGMAFAAPAGPTNVEILRRGIKGGFWPAFLFGLGGVGADFVYCGMIYFGLSGFVEEPLVQLILSAFGALVLFYLAILAFKDISIKSKTSSKTQNKNHFITGFLFTLVNPTTLPEWVGMYGIIFTGTDAQNPLFLFLMLVLGILIMSIVYSTVAVLSHKHMPKRFQKMISFISGIFLLSFAFFFAHRLFEWFLF